MAYNLPNVTFADKDPATIENEIIARAQEKLGITFAPADPRLIFLKTFAYYLSLQRAKIDFTGKQNLLAYAYGDYLDQLGDDLSTLRNPAEFASVTVRFALSAPQLSDVIIQQGKRVTAGDNIFFYTRNSVAIPKNELSIDVACDCLTSGTVGNDYQIGEINILVDPIPYVAAVANIEISGGGVDTESDESLRERIRLAPAKYSTAGADEGYIYWARSSTQDIADVAVYTPQPGEVDVVALMQNGRLPNQAELDQINEVLSAETVRPLTDLVKVVAPRQVDYTIELTYYLNIGDNISISPVQSQVIKAVDDYINWQKSKLARNINPSKLINLVMNAGAARVDVVEPQPLTLKKSEVGNCIGIKITYGGLEND